MIYPVRACLKLVQVVTPYNLLKTAKQIGVDKTSNKSKEEEVSAYDSCYNLLMSYSILPQTAEQLLQLLVDAYNLGAEEANNDPAAA